MQLALKIGTATSTTKHVSLEGESLAVVQPLLANGRPDGCPLLAVDTVGSGTGDPIWISSDGSFGRKWTGDENTPIRWTVVGIVD